jgi:hypothetical protein
MMMSYRCVHCGGYTGEAQREYDAHHGVGVCVGACRYCNEGVPHAEQVCANVRPGEPLPSAVRDFNDQRRAEDRDARRYSRWPF